MSREIKFRGKAKMSIGELDYMHFEHENGWFYGNIVMYGNTPYIVGDFIEVDTEYTINEFWVAVHPESVGQFTGLKDKNDKEIYEGDIVRCYGGAYFNGIYEYDYVIEVRDIRDLNGIIHSENVEILGNKYENPELLEGEK